jgi:hypothetical protein
MLIERGFMTVLRSSEAPCEATLVVILKLLNVLSNPIFNHKIKDGTPIFLKTRVLP